jgi:two-component system sensor histidine kinase/response regulator
VQDIFKRQLKVIGFEAEYADDGKIGLAKIAEKDYGLVITDLHMPNIDGYGLVKTVRTHEKETGKHLPIVAMTADVQLVHQQVYLQHGFDECLLKPVSLGQVKQLLIRWGLLHEAENAEAPKEVPVELPITPLPAVTLKLPDKPAIDPNMAVTQFGAFDDDAKTMIGMFIQMSEPQVKDIENSYSQKDWTKLKGLAHSLKGAARSGLLPATGRCRREAAE